MFHKITNEEYHHGDEWGPMLNASAVKVLIGETPAHFKYFRDHPVATTKDMKIGTAVHTAILEPSEFENTIAQSPNCDRRTNLGKAIFEAFLDPFNYAGKMFIKQTNPSKEFKNENKGKIGLTLEEENGVVAYAQEQSKIGAGKGKTILNYDDFALVRSMADSVEANADARNLLLGMPIREQSIKWKDETFGCWCKARPDMLGFKGQPGGLNAIGDVKTTKKNAKTFRFQAQDFGYLIQARFYCRGMKKLTGKEWKFIFLAVEKAPPHCVSFHVVNDYSDALIDDALEKAGRIFKECSAVGVWPGWSAEVNEIGMTDAGENSILNYMEEK